MSKRIEAFDKLIDSHQHKRIPLELGHVIQSGIRRGKAESIRKLNFWRVIGHLFGVVLLASIILVIFINYSVAVNSRLRQIPLLVSAVEALQFNHSLGQSDEGVDYQEQSNDLKYRLRTSEIADKEVVSFVSDALRLEYPGLKVVESDDGTVFIEIGSYRSEAEAQAVLESLEAFLSAQKITMKIEKTRTID